jgi:hypothetical protein
MGITIDNSIRLLENYHEWEKKSGLDGSGVDDATKKLIEVAKKYQKIEQIVNAELEEYNPLDRNIYRLALIRKVMEDGNVD